MGPCSLPSHMAVCAAGHGDSSSLILTTFMWSHQAWHLLWPVCPIGTAGTFISAFSWLSILIQCTNIQHLHGISPLQNYVTFIFKIQNGLKVPELHKTFGQAAAEQHCHVPNTLGVCESLFAILLNPRIIIEEKNHRTH